MEQVFDEWNTYAGRKELKPRAIDFADIVSNAKLKIVAITGVRRAGKTSVLLLLHQMLTRKKEKVGYINLEDSRIKTDRTVLDNILKWFGGEGYLLLDEITSVNDWESWLARNHEMLKGKLNLIVSSSRKSLVVPNKPLRGRMLAYELYPLSFQEFLQFKDTPLEKTTVGIGRLEKSLDEYLIYGGFPEIALLEDKTDKIRIINSYFKDIIGLDVAEIAKENVSTVELFGRYVVHASYFSASKCLNFFKSVGHKIAKQSLLDLERCSQEGYLFFFVPIFAHTIKDKTQYPRKAYAGDTGFLYAMSGKMNLGKLFENAVLLELKRRILPHQEISYWKDKRGRETDFVICEGLKTKDAIQVVYEFESEKTKERELDGLIECAKELGLKHGSIITKDYESTQTVDGVRISFIPLWKWLLRLHK